MVNKKKAGKKFKGNPMRDKVKDSMKIVDKASYTGNSSAMGMIETIVPYKKYKGKYLKN
tara:strand:+ start:27366 stop:27542 length:177 start_codon:yes stop_codon:yes gene_type:complete